MANVTLLMRRGRQLGTIRPAHSNGLMNAQSGPLSFSMINTRGLITKTVKSAGSIKGGGGGGGGIQSDTVHVFARVARGPLGSDRGERWKLMKMVREKKKKEDN